MINKNLIFTKFLKNIQYILKEKKNLKPIFFISYAAIIFISSFLIYLIIPKFFDYGEKIEHVKKSLNKNYNLNINNFSKIEYNLLPSPSQNIYNVEYTLDNSIVSNIKNKIVIKLHISQLYKFDELKIRKLNLENSILELQDQNLKSFLRYINNLNNNIHIKNSAINIYDSNKKLLVFEKLDFHNKNNKNYILEAEVFDQKINVRFSSKNNLNFKISELGLSGVVIFKDDSSFEFLKGIAKLKLLENNLQFEFEKNKDLKILNSFIRNKIFSSSFDGIININPFFNFNFILNVKKINFSKFLKNPYFEKIILNPELSKKLNGKIKIIANTNRIKQKKIINTEIFLDLENGQVKIEKFKTNFDGAQIFLTGITSEYDDVQRLNFNLDIDIDDEKKFFKKYKNLKKVKDLNNLNIIGFLNMKLKKISINIISVNEKVLNNKKVDFFEDSINNNLIKNDLVNILKHLNIQKFVKENF